MPMKMFQNRLDCLHKITEFDSDSCAANVSEYFIFVDLNNSKKPVFVEFKDFKKII